MGILWVFLVQRGNQALSYPQDCTISLLLCRCKSSLLIDEEGGRLQKGDLCKIYGVFFLQSMPFSTPFLPLNFSFLLVQPPTARSPSSTGVYSGVLFVFALDSAVIVSLSTGCEIPLSGIDFWHHSLGDSFNHSITLNSQLYTFLFCLSVLLTAV